MGMKVYPRFVVVTAGEEPERLMSAITARKNGEGMLCEAKDFFQRTEPGGVVPSGECPGCGALCYRRKCLIVP